MGQKAGKHCDGGERASSPTFAPQQSSRYNKEAISSSVESAPCADLQCFEDEPHRSMQDIRRDTSLTQQKENAALGVKAPSRSTQKKSKPEPQIPISGDKIRPYKGSVTHHAVHEPTSGGDYTPTKPVVRHHERNVEPLTPLSMNTSVNQLDPQATSTPATNGTAAMNGIEHSTFLSREYATDGEQSDDEPMMNLVNTQDSGYGQPQLGYGRFYTSSYLDGSKCNYLNQSSNSLGKDLSHLSHFHMPANFTYSKETPSFLKKKGGGMAALASGGRRVARLKRSTSPAGLRNKEVVRLSMYPGAKPKQPNEPDKIERDDWPGPASPAAIMPEILRERRKSQLYANDDDDEDERQPVDAKIQKEMNEISKIKDESGLGSVIFHELAERQSRTTKAMNPWKASRVPSAKYEPQYDTRFQSPMFASPSRFLDISRRSWDDHDIRSYRSASTLANLPSTRPGYGPSYSTPRAATLPASGLYGGRELAYFRFRDNGREGDGQRGSAFTSMSTMMGYGLCQGQTGVGSPTLFANDTPSIPLLKLQKSTWHTQFDPPIYDYEQLKITQFNLPRDVDRNKLEIHVSDKQFQSLFNMTRDRFHRLAEWKRNDMKRKLDLY